MGLVERLRRFVFAEDQDGFAEIAVLDARLAKSGRKVARFQERLHIARTNLRRAPFVTPTDEQRSEYIMADSEKVENVILGSGEQGKYVAWEPAQAGRRTVVVERALICGSCPNIARLPSKNVVYSAKLAHLVRHGAKYGQRTGPMTTDMAAAVSYASRVRIEWARAVPALTPIATPRTSGDAA